MLFRQYYLGCLSHASYLIGDEVSGRAVVVDPQRDVGEYLADAAAAGLRIERVIETHFHADFVSGHLELAAETGASICFGEAAQAGFPIEHLADGQRLELGDVTIVVLATPGHTPESISLLVFEHADDAAPYGVLTGDTLFIGDVGRPDLLSSAGSRPDDMARQLYRSLQTRLLTLPDDTRVFPAHGAGSACGKSLSTETSSTIGVQKTTNYALAAIGEEQFVAMVTEGQPVAPAYFSFDALRNREQHPLFREHEPPRLLALPEVLASQGRGAIVLDTREPADFASGHLQGSVNVGLSGRFAEYAGDILPPGQPILLVCDEGREDEAKARLARIGFDDVEGALAAPQEAFLEHPELVERSSRISAPELAALLSRRRDITVVDVRGPGERADGFVGGSLSIPLPQLVDRLDEISSDGPAVVYCAGGYRSSIAASVIRRAGHPDVSDLLGGYSAWQVLVGA